MTMKQSPRRPLILRSRRRKLTFQQNPSPVAEPQTVESSHKEPTKPEPTQYFPDGVRVVAHPSMSDTQVIFIPKTADFQAVIQTLSDKGKEFGTQGRNKFMLLCENTSVVKSSYRQPVNDSAPGTTARKPVKAELFNNSSDVPPFTAIKPFNDMECGLLDNSLTDIQWLGEMSACDFEPDPTKQMANKVNQNPDSQILSTKPETAYYPTLERPPYSYMAMIQFAINSRKSMRMTLKEIYTWIEDHFPYFREVAKPGWKNSIRHNLSLHDMFIRETSPVGKVSLWTIRPEANRCLTLDQVNRQQRIITHARKTIPSLGRRVKSFSPRNESSLISNQPPATSSMFMLSPQDQFPSSCTQPKQTPSRGVKRVRISPKVSQSEISPAAMYPQTKVKDEPIPIKCETPKPLSERRSSSSRRKQNLVNSVKHEPILLCTGNTTFGSDVVTDASTFQDTDFSPIGTPVRPRHSFTPFGFSSTPVKDWLLFSSPRELRQARGSTPTNISIRRAFNRDAMNDSLSDVLLDLGFPCMDEEDLNFCNISLSEILSLIK